MLETAISTCVRRWSNWEINVLGYFAGALVLAAFAMKSMRPLRLTAITSNLASICYAIVTDMQPILVLHGILLPLNVLRFAQTGNVPVVSLLTAAHSHAEVRPGPSDHRAEGRSTAAVTLLISLIFVVAAAVISERTQCGRPAMPDWPVGSI